MATKVAINGFGRIGRLVARAIFERTDHDLELVAINDLADAKSNALLFAFDSVHGRFKGDVTADGDAIILRNDRGAFRAAAKVTPRIQAGAVWMRDGWPGANALTDGAATLPDAALTAFPFAVGQSGFGARVEVERAAIASRPE